MVARSPSSNLIAALDAELQHHAPFVLMSVPHRRRFIEVAEEAYFAPGETVLEPACGPVTHLHYIRQGEVHGERGPGRPEPFDLEVGDLFPISALLGARPVTATYRARSDTFCLLVPAATVRELAVASPPFAEFLNHKLLQLLDLSQRALRNVFASRALADQSLDAPLAQFARRTPLAVAPSTPLGEALRAMHDRHVGSVLVVDADGGALGILTRHDVLGRVTLPGLALATPISAVMSQPVHTLGTDARAYEAALLMSREGLRHVPITDNARVVGIVSERDLFALQRQSLRQIANDIAAAANVEQVSEVAGNVRRFVCQLLGQGLGARQLTQLVSHLNDRVTTRLVDLLAREHALDLKLACWLAFGSEGRAEQTIATDQDNGLVFVSDAPDADRPRWLALGQAVNEALDACGFPLCRGGVMAGQEACCRTVAEWQDRFAAWIEHGAPHDLLNASIYFDLRPVAGARALAEPLRRFLVAEAATPRFLRQMAESALTHAAPLNWHGAIAGGSIDLKLQGTALYVEAARLLALACGIDQTSTRLRLEGAAAKLGVPVAEAEAWVAGFEYLQLLRLGVQVAQPRAESPNRCQIDSLNEFDQRMLRETLRVARRLQQRVELDYLR